MAVHAANSAEVLRNVQQGSSRAIDEGSTGVEPIVPPSRDLTEAPVSTQAGAVAGAVAGALAGAVVGHTPRTTLTVAATGAVAGAIMANIVTETRNAWSVSQKTLARMTGCSQRALAGWEAGGTLTAERRRRFVEMSRLHAALSGIMRPESLARWLEEPAPAFDGSSPLQIIERGEIDRLWEMIYDVRMGEAF